MLVGLDRRESRKTFSVTIGAPIIQNTLQRDLPASFLTQFPSSAEISYDIIPTIGSLPEPLRTLVRNALAVSTSNIWWCVMGFALAGLIVTLTREIVLQICY